MSERTKRSTNAKRRLFGRTEEPSEGQPSSSSAASAAPSADANVVLETPQKKRNQRSNFFSPQGKPVVTPDKIEGDDDDEVQIVSPPAKKTRLSAQYSHPKDEKKEEGGEYVPTYIDKNLSYKRKGVASLPFTVEKTYQLVIDHYHIPKDFEHNRSYGPLSGTSYEERVIGAYRLSLLEPQDQSVEICSNCATLGHLRNDCPELIYS